MSPKILVDRVFYEQLVDRCAGLRVYCETRIRQCQHDEEIYARVSGSSQAAHMVSEAVMERRALQRVLSILDGKVPT